MKEGIHIKGYTLCKASFTGLSTGAESSDGPGGVCRALYVPAPPGRRLNKCRPGWEGP